MAKAKKTSNTAAAGIQATSTTEGTTQKRHQETYSDDLFIDTYIKARLEGSSPQTAGDYAYQISGGTGSYNAPRENPNSQIAAGLANGTMYQQNGRTYYTPSAQQAYINRVKETQASNDWESRKQNGIGVGTAIAGGALSGLWQNVTGGINAGAAAVGKGISSQAANSWLGDSATTNAGANRLSTLAKLKQIWEDGSFGSNVKDSVFTIYDSAFKDLIDGMGRIRYPQLDAIAKGSNVLFKTLRDYVLPKITGTQDPAVNAQWLTDQAYGVSDTLTQGVAGLGGIAQYVDSDTLQGALQNSSPVARKAGQVSNVVANMLPSIITSIVTKDPDAGLGQMAINAGGSAAKEAYNKGASAYQSAYVGAEKGYTEYMTERLSDFVGAFGGGMISPTLQKKLGDLALTKAGRVLIKLADLYGENVEEAISDWAAPGIDRAVWGNEDEEDLSILQALAGQAPWTEDGIVTLLSTLLLGGIGNVIQNGTSNLTKEETQEILDVAKSSGNQRLINLAQEYETVLNRKGKLGAGKIQTVQEASQRVMGEDAYVQAIMQAQAKRKAAQERETAQRSETKLLSGMVQNEVQPNVRADTAGATVQTDRGPEKVEFIRDGDRNAFRLTAEDGSTRIVSGQEASAMGLNDNVMQLVGALSALGENAPAAYSVYDGSMDVDKYAAAMYQAVEFYAGNGTDVRKAAQKVRESNGFSLIGQLSDVQLEMAQALGTKIYEQKQTGVQERAAKLREIRKAYQEAMNRSTDTTASQELQQVNAAIADARQYISDVQEAVSLTREDMTALASLGRQDSEEYRALQQAVNDYEKDIRQTQGVIGEMEKTRKELQAKQPVKRKKGTVSFDGANDGKNSYEGVNPEKLNKKQKAVVDMTERLADVLDIDFSFFQGPAGMGGFYRGGNSIAVNINSGMGVGDFNHVIAAGSLSHELTHWLKQYAPEEYEALKRFILNDIGVDKLEKMIEQQQRWEKGRLLSREEATDEIVANACQTMLRDSNAITELAEQNRTLAEKIKDFIRDLIDRIKAAFEDVNINDNAPIYEAARAIQGEYEDILKLWDNALREAAETSRAVRAMEAESAESTEENELPFQKWDEAAENVGIQIDRKSESAAPSNVQFSLWSWDESEYVKKRDEAVTALAQALGVSKAKATSYIDSINGVAKAIAEDKQRLDYEASEGVSALVGNTEYGGSIDFSTICKKRRLLTGTFTAIQRALPNTALTADEILTIRRMMDDKGYEVSCGLCYVEGSRAKMGEYARQFLDEYTKTNPEYLPNMAEINTPEGIEQIRKQHPDTYAAYVKFMNGLAQRKPKLYQLATEYKGEVLSKFLGKDKMVEKYNHNGGLRLQSFSDFEIIHLIDNMQVIMDMARVGLNGQAYTKVPEFAWAMGKTGLKINMSLIAKGVDANGRIVLDEKEGMKRKDAEALRDAYPENVGTIIVVFSDEQLKAAMADDFIDFIIPFHRSQWNSQQYALMGLPEGAKDFTPWQNESYIEPVLNKNGKKLRPDNYMPNNYWDYSKTGKENAENYLRMCAENNRKPKFSNLLVDNGDGSYSLQSDGSTDGYWKLLIDFKMYDNNGNGAPQKPVQPIFNEGSEDDPHTVLGMLKAYKGGHQSFPVAQDIVDEFVGKYKEQHADRTQFQQWDNTVSRSPQRSWEIQAKIDKAAELESMVKEYYEDGLIDPDSGNWLYPEEIESLMEPNLYSPDGMLSGAEQIMINLSNATKEENPDTGGLAMSRAERKRTFELMDAILPYLSPVQQANWADHRSSRNAGFTAYYDKKHPSIYYRGYQPGKLDKPKEMRHLRDLIEQEDTPEDLRREAQIMLDAMNSGANTTWYQKWDDSDEDTRNEREGRTVAYTRIQGENRTLKETIDELNAAIGKQNTTIEKLQNSLKLGKGPEVREAEARKMAGSLLKKFNSTADKETVAQEIKAMGDYILQNRKLDENELKQQARAIAASVLNESTTEVDADEDVPAIRDLLGKIPKKLSISDLNLGELDKVDGYNEFRKRNIGNFILTKRVNDKNVPGYKSLDSVYSDLQPSNRAYLPDVTNEGEMAIVLSELFERAKPKIINPHEQYMGEAIEELSNQITQEMIGGIFKPTTGEAEAKRLAKELDKAIAAGTENAGALAKAAKELEGALESSEGSVRAMNNYIKRLRDTQDEAANKELDMLRETIYDLTIALDQAGSRYKTLKVSADMRMAQIRAEGRAREEEKLAKQKAKEYEHIASVRDHYKDMAQRAKERRKESEGVTKYRKQVIEKSKKLSDWLLKNSDKEHVPEVLKRPLLELLTSIDYTSKRALAGGEETQADRKFGARLQRLEQLLSQQQSYINGDGDVDADLGGYIDIGPDMLSFLRDMAQNVTNAMNTGTDYTINQMDAQQLKDLSNLLSTLSAGIRNMNKLMANARYTTVRDAASQDITYMESLGNAPESAGNKLSKFLQWQDAVPYYAMKRFGKGGQAIFDGLTRGWETLAKNAKEIIDFTEKAYTGKEVNDWKAEIHNVTLEDGSKIRMTTAQIMELSMLLRRDQARKHLFAGGLRIGNIETGKGMKHRTIADTEHYHITTEDIRTLLGELTPRQMDVANALQQYMAERGAEWGNEVSMKRFGYNFYTEGENYYPIKTDANDRPMRDTDAIENSMFRLLNLSSSKSLNPKASNALVVNDIFDTFADHMADQAKLNALGLPILDAIKWFNYKERIDNDDGTYNTRTLQAAMEKAYQSEAQRYFRTLMKDINGVHEGGDRSTGVISKLTSNFKVASVGANLRVALLQPTAYVRALTLLSPRNLARAFAYKGGINEALQWSGTALWKSMGYFDTNISRNMRDQIKHNETAKSKIQEASMTLAEKGDSVTWGRLWTACKLQTQQLHPDLTGDKLMMATADLFRGVIYSSQVMDSTLTRSEIMRSTTAYDKLATAFMAEPTLSYNVLLDAYSEYQRDVRRNGKQGAWKRNQDKLKLGFTVYVSSAVVSAIAESLWDAVRDDDDYESFLEKFLNAFFGEETGLKALFAGNLQQDLNPLAKLPYAKDIISLLSGYSSGNMATDAVANLIKAFEIWKETIELERGILDKPTKTTYYGNMQPWGKIYKTLQALSQLSGLPASAAARDVVAIWNTTVGSIVPYYKVKTYDAGPKSNIKSAYAEGRMTFNEAVDQMLANGVFTNREDAEKELTKAGSSLSPDMDNLLNSIRRGNNESAEKIRQNMVEHGTPVSYIRNNVQNDVKEQYLAGNISYESALAALTNYGGVNATEAGSELKWWEFSNENFAEINTNGNKDIEQAELGNYLLRQIEDKKMTYAEAEEIWKGRNAGVTSPWKDSFGKWSTSASYNTLKRAALDGNTAEYNNTLQALTNNGVKEKDAKARVKTFIKNFYFGNDLSDAEAEIVGSRTLSDWQAQSMLISYAGMNADDARDAVAEWSETRTFANTHGDEYEKYDLTVQQAKYWYDNSLSSAVSLPAYAKQVESYGMDRVKSYYGKDGWIQTGLTMDQYDTYATGRSQCKGTDNDGDGKTDSGSVKVQALMVINALPVSNAVKDAIYMKNGWSERTIYEAPWH